MNLQTDSAIKHTASSAVTHGPRVWKRWVMKQKKLCVCVCIIVCKGVWLQRTLQGMWCCFWWTQSSWTHTHTHTHTQTNKPIFKLQANTWRYKTDYPSKSQKYTCSAHVCAHTHTHILRVCVCVCVHIVENIYKEQRCFRCLCKKKFVSDLLILRFHRCPKTSESINNKDGVEMYSCWVENKKLKKYKGMSE